MKAENLLHSLKSSGIELRAEGESLKWRAPKGIMISELRDSIKNHKAELLALLQTNEADDYRQNFVNQIIQGDCLDKLKILPDDSVDLIVTDPPYGLKFMGKDWDKAVPGVEIWKECLRVLKPGAFAFIMSSPKQHLLCRNFINIEKAGFKTHFDSIYWTYASGCPSVHNIGILIDKKFGAERDKIARNPNSRENSDKSNTIYESGTVGKTAYITKPATEEARRLDGSHAGFNPKPAVEVIIVVMKPLDEKSYTDQALSNGKGITWLDDCLIPYKDEPVAYRDFTKQKSYDGNQVQASKGDEWIGNAQGRFPANLLVSDNVFDDTSRYFSLDAWADFSIKDLPEQVQRNLPFLIVPKASKKEKNAGMDGYKKEKNKHLTVKPIKLMAYLITMGSREGDVVLDPFCGSGTTCVAAKMLKRRYIGVELSSDYHEIANRRIEHAAIKDAA
jgi:site-specific DNA-methyltransferase (adenine-specific)